MILNKYGEIVKKYWLEIPNHFPNVVLDEFLVMPNHIHGIIIIDVPVGANNHLPKIVGANNHLPKIIRAKDFSPLQHGTSKTIGSIIRGFKIGVVKWFRKNTNVYIIWQRNYYDRIIRDEKSLNKIREYIFNNFLKWEFDKNNPKNL